MSTATYTAGWYQDPTGRFTQRYHDGTAWTQHVVGHAGQQGTDPLTVDLGSTPPVPVGMSTMRQQTTNGMAIASMVLGILWLYWVGSILAVIFGFVAKRQIRDANGAQGGGGMATAGLVLGFIGVGTLALVLIIVVIAAIGSSSSGSYGMGGLGVLR